MNYCLNELKKKGLIKISNFKKNPKKLRYIYLLTPNGITIKTKLTINFMKKKMQEYDELQKEIKKNKILITGSAGFIGFHVCRVFLQKKYEVLGIDNLNNYYDVKLKKDRINFLKKNFKNFQFLKVDFSNKKELIRVFKKFIH